MIFHKRLLKLYRKNIYHLPKKAIWMEFLFTSFFKQRINLTFWWIKYFLNFLKNSLKIHNKFLCNGYLKTFADSQKISEIFFMQKFLH